MEPEAFEITIPKWFSRFKEEVLKNLRRRYKYVCEDFDVDHPWLRELQAKHAFLEFALKAIESYLWDYKMRDNDTDDDSLACMKQAGDPAVMSEVYSVYVPEESEHGFSASFVFAKGCYNRKIVILSEGGVAVGWDSPTYKKYGDEVLKTGEDKGIVCLREEDSSEEFFDKVLHMDWGLLAKCSIRHGTFAASVNMIEYEGGLDKCAYDEILDMVYEIESGSEKLYDLAAEALGRDFNYGSNYSEAVFSEDYVLRYAVALVEKSNADPVAKRKTMHDLEKVFTQMRKYERLSFDHMLLQHYSSTDEWRLQIEEVSTVNYFMSTLYECLPERLIGHCTRGAIGLPNEQEEL